MPWRDLFPWLPPITGDLLAMEETVHFLAGVICICVCMCVRDISAYTLNMMPEVLFRFEPVTD